MRKMNVFFLVGFLFVSCGFSAHSNQDKPLSHHDSIEQWSNEVAQDLESHHIDVAGDCVRLASWNIANLGKSKDDQEIDYMAKVLKDFDVVAIQEVVAGEGGAQAVARLVDDLNRKGSKWDYVVSNPTTGNGVERYAFLWRPHRVKISGKAWLEQHVADLIDREPFLARFEFGGKKFIVANLHAVPKDKGPNTEIAALKDLSIWYPQEAIVLVGDCNATHDESGAQALYKSGFKDVLGNQKTTLKMKLGENNEHLANAYDHIYLEEKEWQIHDHGVYDTSQDWSDLKTTRLISDHIPVWACLSVR
jgi:endonuclease/exonuclease/phosphatase family metal-dependent hydrolase